MAFGYRIILCTSRFLKPPKRKENSGVDLYTGYITRYPTMAVCSCSNNYEISDDYFPYYYETKQSPFPAFFSFKIIAFFYNYCCINFFFQEKPFVVEKVLLYFFFLCTLEFSSNTFIFAKEGRKKKKKVILFVSELKDWFIYRIHRKYIISGLKI